MVCRDMILSAKSMTGEISPATSPDFQSLAEQNMGLANMVAGKRRHSRSFYGVLDFEDLKQEAALGLVEAASRFKTESGLFTAFAMQRINGQIVDALRSADPQGRRKKVIEVRLVSVEQLAANSSELAPSIDQELFRSGQSADSAENQFFATLTEDTAQKQADLDSVLNRFLNPRQEQVVRLRVGLGGAERQTGAEIGRILKVSSSRISQIYCEAIGILSKPPAAEQIREILLSE